MVDLKDMKTTELKELAKKAKVRNWWVLKKEELITELEKLQPKEEVLPELTGLEYQIMTRIPKDDFYENGLDSVLWTDILLDNVGMDNKKARGVLSSLKQKGLLDFYSTKEKSDGAGCTDSTTQLTELGKVWMTKYLAGEIKNNLKEVKVPEAKQSEEIQDENIITLKELITEAGIKGTKARRLLRNSEIERPYKRWEWHKEHHKDIIKKVKDILK